MSVLNSTLEYKISHRKSKIEDIAAYLSILKYNIKILINLNVIVSIIFIILAPVIFSVKLLDSTSIASISEYYLSLLGVILIPYIANIEDLNNIKEVVYIRKTSQVKITISRIIIAVTFMTIMILGVLFYAKTQGSSFNLLEMVLGTWISAMFLGILGFTVANLIQNISALYLVCFSYYFLEYFTKGKYSKDLYLFSLTSGSFKSGKLVLLCIIFFMIIFNMIFIKKKS